MKKSFIIPVLFTAILIPFACKKSSNSNNSSNTTSGSTTSSTTSNTTSGSTTGSTTSGSTTGGSSNTLTVTTGTATTNQTLVNFGVVNVTYPTNAYSFNANTNPNYYAAQSVIPGTSTLNIGTYSVSGSPSNLGGTLGNLQATINSGLGSLPMGTYIGLSGTFTATALNGKQRIQYNNITFAQMTSTGTLSATYTAAISADYVQP